MSLKSKISKELDKRNNVYPCLMQGFMTKTILLFSSEGEGIVVFSYDPDLFPIGSYWNDLDMSKFIPYDGSVTIESE